MRQLVPFTLMWISIYILFILCSVFFIPRVLDEWLIPKNAIFTTGGLIIIASTFYFKRYQELKNIRNEPRRF